MYSQECQEILGVQEVLHHIEDYFFKKNHLTDLELFYSSGVTSLG